jgi:hypothetical protein
MEDDGDAVRRGSVAVIDDPEQFANKPHLRRPLARILRR